MRIVSTLPSWASTDAPISSLKYGKCHKWGSSTTPSSETNSPAVIFLMAVPPSRKLSVVLPGRRRQTAELIGPTPRPRALLDGDVAAHVGETVARSVVADEAADRRPAVLARPE